MGRVQQTASALEAKLLECQRHGIGRLPIDADHDSGYAGACEAGRQPNVDLIEAQEGGLGTGEENRKVLAVDGARHAALALSVPDARAI